MAQAVAHHRATLGNWCEGYLREPHGATDLTADHIVPRAQGGLNGPLRILCRQCNSRRGAYTQHNA